MFVKAVFAAGDNRDADMGVKHTAGILILAYLKTLAADGGLRGRGKQWMWYNNTPIQPDKEWN